MADAARLPGGGGAGASLGRRRAGGRGAAAPRRRAGGQDHHAAAGLEGRHRRPAAPAHPQPVGPGAHGRRLERRERRRGRDGMAPLALGTDGGGSIRIPARSAGSRGSSRRSAASRSGPPSPFGLLAHAGPMARTVTDAALLLDVLAEPDAREWTAAAAARRALPRRARGRHRGPADRVQPGSRLRRRGPGGRGGGRGGGAGARGARRASSSAATPASRTRGRPSTSSGPPARRPRSPACLPVSVRCWTRAWRSAPSSAARFTARVWLEADGRRAALGSHMGALPRALGPSRDPDPADRGLRGRARGARRQRGPPLAGMDAVHLPVQPHAAAGGDACRAAAPPPGCRSGCRSSARATREATVLRAARAYEAAHPWAGDAA